MPASDYDHYAEQVVTPGKTVPLSLNMLRNPPAANGEHPLLNIEYLGDTNDAFQNDSIAKANAKTQIGDDNTKWSKAKWVELTEKNRETLIKYAVRKIEHVYRRDGSKVDEVDIAGFMKRLSADIIWVIWRFAINADNFREPGSYPDPATVKPLAEKS